MSQTNNQKTLAAGGFSARVARENFMQLVLDPKAFNYLIMVLYGLNACRWAIEGKWADVSYWLCALGITATVTFGYSH